MSETASGYGEEGEKSHIVAEVKNYSRLMLLAKGEDGRRGPWRR